MFNVQRETRYSFITDLISVHTRDLKLYGQSIAMDDKNTVNKYTPELMLYKIIPFLDLKTACLHYLIKEPKVFRPLIKLNKLDLIYHNTVMLFQSCYKVCLYLSKDLVTTEPIWFSFTG